MTGRYGFALLALLLASSAHAQNARPLAIDMTQSGTLAADGADQYTLDLDAGTFVSGAADQRSVDVVVTVTGPDGAEVGAFDASARGPEWVQFQAERAGTYTFIVAPFEGAAGDYALTLDRAEPLATTPAGRVDQMLARFDGDDRPGVLVAVVEDGEIVFETAYGMANLTHGVPMTLDTRTNIGSTSKQFTAFALTLLADRGQLSLDDDVRDHLPELPDLGATVTVRNLLTHTSGYREFLNLLALAGRRIDTGSYVDRAEIVSMIQRQPALQDAPGTVFNYNNSGYALAAMIVERVTGETFPDWMAENVFRPLGMAHTVVRADPTVIVPNSAQGYLRGDDGRWHDAVDLYGAMGAGGIYTTVGDLARWMTNYDTAALGGPDVIREMTTPTVLAGGDTTDYGLGLFIDEVGGQRRFHHGGADNAHRSMVEFFPDLNAGVIVEFNAPENATGFADRIAQTFFEDRFTSEPAATAEVDVEAAAFDDALFDDYEGRYALDVAPTFVLAFRRDGEGGYLTQATGQQELEILPTSDSTFALTAVEASVTFHRDADGVVRSATLHQNGDNRATKLGVDPMAEAVPTDLGDYAGRYVSAELDVAYRLAVEDGALVAHLPNTVEAFAARETTPDTFLVSAYGGFPITLSFRRDAAGAVTGFEADAGGRTRNVLFERADAPASR